MRGRRSWSAVGRAAGARPDDRWKQIATTVVTVVGALLALIDEAKQRHLRDTGRVG